MRVALLGNSGSGKSTLARALGQAHAVPVLALDAIVWEAGEVAVPRPPEVVAAELEAFAAADAWVVEGCYGELVARVAPRLTELLWLDPGVEVCLANNRRRPWEPEKYADPDAQDAQLESLLAWVASYDTRDDAWSRRAHAAVFAAFPGPKRHLTSWAEIAAGAGLLGAR